MCVAGEEPADSVGTGASAGGSTPEIIVTAPRIGVLDSVAEAIDWSEVANQTTIGIAGGLLSGGLYGAAVLGGTAALHSIESQDGVDLNESFELKDDMIVIPELGGAYFSLH